jgi:tetratricopeptide (TPR) repeat protein
MQREIAWHLQVLTLSEKVHGPDHPRTANILYNLGRIQVKQGERLFCNALKIFQAYSGPSLPETLNCLQHLGMTLERQNRYTEALEYFNQAYETLRSISDATDKGTLLAQKDVGRVLRLLGQTSATSSNSA